jgi:phage terminase large subunit-like protein
VPAIQPHLPNWVTLVPVRLVKGKDFRFEQVFGDYQRGRVVHAADFPMLVEQLMAFPHGRRDDVADAAVGVIHHLLSEGAR